MKKIYLFLVFVVVFFQSNQLQVYRRHRKDNKNSQFPQNLKNKFKTPILNKNNRFKLKSKKSQRFTMRKANKIEDGLSKEIEKKAKEETQQEDFKEQNEFIDKEFDQLLQVIMEKYRSCKDLKVLTYEKKEEDDTVQKEVGGELKQDGDEQKEDVGKQKEDTDQQKDGDKKQDKLITVNEFIEKISNDKGQMKQYEEYTNNWLQKKEQQAKTGLKYLFKASLLALKISKMLKGPLSYLIKKIGIFGAVITLGIKVILLPYKLYTINQRKAESLYKNSDFGKTMKALDEIKASLADLDTKIDKMFQDLKQINELNTAKQVIYQSTEIVLYASSQFQILQQKCQTQIKDNLPQEQQVITKQDNQESNEDEKQQDYDQNDVNLNCDFYQKKFINNLNNLNFDFHYKLLLKTYAGEKTFIDIDYFDAVSKAFQHNIEPVKAHYEQFQELIKSASLSYVIYNQLNAKYYYEQKNHDENIMRIINNYKSSSETIVKTIDLVVRVTSCDNCIKLDFQNRLWLAIGDKRYCYRTQQDNQDCDSIADIYSQNDNEKKIIEDLLKEQKKDIYDFNQDLKNNFEKFVQNYNEEQNFNNINFLIKNSLPDIQQKIASVYYTFTQDQKVKKLNYIYQFITQGVQNKDVTYKKQQNIYEFNSKNIDPYNANAKAIVVYKSIPEEKNRKKDFEDLLNKHINFLQKELNSWWNSHIKYKGEECDKIFKKNYQKILEKYKQYDFQCYASYKNEDKTFKFFSTFYFNEDSIKQTKKYLDQKSKDYKDHEYTVIFDNQYNSMYLKIDSKMNFSEKNYIEIFVSFSNLK